MNTARPESAEREPTNVEELLDREEACAIGAIAGALERVGEDLFEATELRTRIREYPLLAMGLAASVGFVAAPLTLGLLKRAASLSASAGLPGSLPSGTLPELLKSSLRGVRAPL